jgi:SAM-dependent methyltransferase/uncharacterized protein YbaR (Trm112 family)
MKLSYLKYLKCFCDSDEFSAYRLEDEHLKNVPITNDEEIINIGLLKCNCCHRYYPIDEGILTALPDNLLDEGYHEFIRQYDHSLPAGDKGEKVSLLKELEEQEEMMISYKKNEIKVRNAQAPQYHTFGYWVYGLNEVRVFQNSIKLCEEDVIVELGCGTGRITKEVISHGFSEYIAIDFSAESLKLLRATLSDEVKNNILLMKADVCNLPLKANMANKVFSAQVLEHIPGLTEQQKFIKAIKRILSIDGLAAITMYNYSLKKRFNKEILKKGFHGGEIYYENFTRREVKKLFEPYLIINKIFGINCFFPYARRLNVKTQMIIDSILSRTIMSSLLGDLLFISVKK